MKPIVNEHGPQLPGFAGFGPGSHIYEPFTVSCSERIVVGSDVHIGPGAWLSVVDEYNGRRYDPHLLIGDGVSLGPDIVIACIGEIAIGPRVQTAPRVFIGDTYHDYRDPHTAVMDQPLSDPRPVSIGAGSFLGVGSVVLHGVKLGERVFVAANAVVTGDVPANCVVAGNPARIIKRWDARRERWEAPRPRLRGRPMSRAVPSPEPGSAGFQTGHQPAGADVIRRQIATLEHRAALAEAERAATDQEVEALTLRHQQLQSMFDEARRERLAAEYWLQEHRRSGSWRITAPLRMAKRKRLALRWRSPR